MSRPETLDEIRRHLLGLPAAARNGSPIQRAMAKAAPVTLAIAGKLVGAPLADFDKALDEARRTHWVMGFSGLPLAAAVREVQPGELALSILPLLEGWSVHEADDLITEARFIAWMAVWAGVEGSAFAERFRAEEAGRLLKTPLGTC